MKTRGDTLSGDGFDRNVAEKMPKIRRLEEVPVSILDGEPQPLSEEGGEVVQNMRPLEKPVEKKTIFESPGKESKAEENGDVLGLIEDLHAQLLVSGRTKRALEMDLASHRKTIYQLAQDNKDLRRQVEELKAELQSHKEIQSESTYLKEENSDALERIQEFHQELRNMNEVLSRTTGERDEALRRISNLESRLEQNDVLQLKGRLKEREALQFCEENRELQSELEKTSAKNVDLEKKYETLRKSFNEVKESLTVLRDSCKMSYYNLPGIPEESV